MEDQIDITVDYRHVMDALNELHRKGDNLETSFQEIGEYLIESTRQRINAGMAPSGERWQPLADLTARMKGHSKPLIGETKRLSSEWHYNASPNKLVFGTNVAYAAVQHYGSTIKPVKAKALHFGNVFAKSVTIPARPMLGVSEDDAVTIVDILKGYYSE